MFRFFLFLVLLFCTIQNHVFAVFTMYNAKTGTLNWGTKSDWIRHLSGTIAYPAGAAAATVTVTGTSTLFTSELIVGDIILLQLSPGTSFGTVASISSNTSMTVTLTNTVTLQTGRAFGIQSIPTTNDNLTIMNPNVTSATTDAQVDVSGGTVNSITLNVQANNISITFLSTNSLTVNSTIVVNQGASNSYTNSLLLNAGSMTVNGVLSLGTNNVTTGFSQFTITTGTLNLMSDLSFLSGTYSKATMSMTSTGRVNLYGVITYTTSTNIGQILGGTTSVFNYCSSTVKQFFYTHPGTGGAPYFVYANVWFNNTSASGIEFSTGGGNSASQIVNDFLIQSGTFHNKLTSGKIIGNGGTSTFGVSNGATYRVYGSDANALVPYSTFTNVTLGPTSNVRIHTTNDPFLDHVVYGNVFIEPASTCSVYIKDATEYFIAGNLVIGDGTVVVTLKGQLSGTITVSGNLTISANATLDCATKTNNVNLAGNWIDNGTFTPGTNLVTFNGTTQQTITDAAGETFYALTVNNSYTASYSIVLNNSITITNALTLTAGIIKTEATKLLAITSTGSSTSGLATSFIEGPMSKAGTTAFVFPVGKGTRWRRLAIGTPSASSTYVVEYFYVPYSNTTTFTAPLTRVSKIEYWELDRTAGAGNATVTLYWENASTSGITDCSDLTIGHWTGATWVQRVGVASGTCTGTGTGNIPSTASVTLNATNAITFASISPTINPLPIALVDFKVNSCEEYNCISWSTENELNNDYFVVEKLNLNSDYTIVANVKGAGNSMEFLNYAIVDYNVQPVVNYYRLVQFDFDGTATSSELISVDNSIVSREMKIINVINLLGQEVNHDYRGLVIVHYENGSILKVLQ